MASKQDDKTAVSEKKWCFICGKGPEELPLVLFNE